MTGSTFIMLVCLLVLLGTSRSEHICDDGDIKCEVDKHFDIEVKQEDIDIDASWTYTSNVSDIDGFRAVIYKDDSVSYRSPLLHPSVRSMILETELESGQSKVCIQVLINKTEVVTEKCETFKITDLKIIIGILAGTVFLVPCLVALFCIIYKDRLVAERTYEKMQQQDQYNANTPAIEIVIEATSEKIENEKIAEKMQKEKNVEQINEGFISENEKKLNPDNTQVSTNDDNNSNSIANKDIDLNSSDKKMEAECNSTETVNTTKDIKSEESESNQTLSVKL